MRLKTLFEMEAIGPPTLNIFSIILKSLLLSAPLKTIPTKYTMKKAKPPTPTANTP
jgi:hypothetical protein